ncbi:MAG: prepilin-type N-terminal cleavage/methylation domain-containing protein [Deltaproteobacteria bacterium]|nr:prepilin-type N-terminal cleavage/methylation domain-containing protein [Deltaproteobacteria bacterium]
MRKLHEVKYKSGFSLIELVITMAVGTIGLLALSHMLVSSYQTQTNLLKQLDIQNFLARLDLAINQSDSCTSGLNQQILNPNGVTVLDEIKNRSGAAIIRRGDRPLNDTNGFRLETLNLTLETPPAGTPVQIPSGRNTFYADLNICLAKSHDTSISCENSPQNITRSFPLVLDTLTDGGVTRVAQCRQMKTVPLQYGIKFVNYVDLAWYNSPPPPPGTPAPPEPDDNKNMIVLLPSGLNNSARILVKNPDQPKAALVPITIQRNSDGSGLIGDLRTLGPGGRDSDVQSPLSDNTGYDVYLISKTMGKNPRLLFTKSGNTPEMPPEYALRSELLWFIAYNPWSFEGNVKNTSGIVKFIDLGFGICAYPNYTEFNIPLLNRYDTSSEINISFVGKAPNSATYVRLIGAKYSVDNYGIPFGLKTDADPSNDPKFCIKYTIPTVNFEIYKECVGQDSFVTIPTPPLTIKVKGENSKFPPWPPSIILSVWGWKIPTPMGR